ncbi:MAG TPA: tetratricopeptide repeat protein [Ideonella sp.]|uniref:tetratricopeptide repeat protein n=1 Tax=Ideonella sp. TaxID=1929293 RepID=UPI002E35F9E9|nr:tetratricopeptide repeat protein [Ideonella sp.]HEX5687084.1 tetratricopeptide repeat protein [Ideonella sp.]
MHAAEPAKPDRSVKAPHYGDTLFYFFQDRPFPALTGLMVSQQFERLPRHEDEAEVLRGGLLLGYGLHREAGEIFAGLIERGAEPAVRDRAWYYLAKIRYQRGSPEEAGEALSHIERPLPGALEDERSLLAGQIRLALGDAPGAADSFRALLARPPVPEIKPTAKGQPEPPKPGFFSRIGSWLVDAVTLNFGRGNDVPVSTAPAYARFNLGVALIRSGDVEGGRALLDELGRTPMHSEELRVLRDQANVALGFTALTQDDPEGAAKALERVRLQGLHSNKALLGFGWAAAAQKKPAQALVPWMELAGRDPSDAAVLEARIAVPYALAELGAYGQALARYQEAINAYDQEHKALNESIAAIRAGDLVKGLTERNPAEDMGWFLPITQLPEMPHQGHLAPVLAGHDFQEAFKNYRDLNFLSHNLTEWQDKLGIYGDMLDHRRKAFVERLPQVRQRSAELRVDDLQRQRDALAGEYEAAEAAADGLAYATPAERAQQARLAGAQRLLAEGGDAVKAEVDADAVSERLRRLSGALTWQLAQSLPERRWAAEKGLRETDKQLAEAREHDAKLDAAQRTEPAKFDAFAVRLNELSGRIKALQPRVAALTTEQQQALQDTAVQALQTQQERLVGYTNQARYAVAQLYDRATQKPGDAKPSESKPADGEQGGPRANP